MSGALPPSGGAVRLLLDAELLVKAGLHELDRERLDKLLARLLPTETRATLQRWIDDGRVTVDGRPCRARDKVGVGALIELTPGPAETTSAVADASVPFTVIYEDAHLLVVDKPAGVVVHPARGHATGTLVNGLIARGSFDLAALAAPAPDATADRLAADEEEPDGDDDGAAAEAREAVAALRPGIVHRIDKDTSGLLVVARDARTREGLKAQLAAHTVERRYLALTVGVPISGRIETLHGRHPKYRLKFSSKVSAGKHAVTKVSVLERFGTFAAYIACELETGRTHQIRVHLGEHAETPLLADALYGTAVAPGPLGPIGKQLGRQALHAAVLGFVHPISGETLRFESPLPTDMEAALAALRALPT